MSAKHDHSELVHRVQEKLPSDERLFELGDLFKVFGDTTRIKLLYALFEEDMCVCAMTELTHMEQSAISHQLRILKDAKLVGCRKEGRTSVYFLADDHVRQIIGMGYEHISEEK